MKTNYKHRIKKSSVFEGVIILFAFLITLPLFAIIFYVLKTGLSKLSWDFLVNIPQPVGEIGGGIANALIGSLMIVLVATVIAVPIGIMGGIYLSENRNKKLAYWSRLAVDILQGTPSIVVGIVIYFWVVKPVGGFSALSGSVALALGMPYHKVILRVIVPCGFSGILSGIMISVARIAGETAPLLFTAFGNPYVTTHLLKPMQSLPLLIFNYATSPYDEWHDLAWGASLILLIWVLILNISTKLITNKWKVQF
jgi:phosphate transport system permease protein